MSKTRLYSAAALLISLLIAHAANAQPSGTYTGQIESSGRYVPAVTTFKTDDRGRIGGSYRYTENKRRYPGTLDDCEYNGSVNLRCVWRDEAGEGVVTFAFDNGFGRFVGLWKGDQMYGWSGKKHTK